MNSMQQLLTIISSEFIDAAHKLTVDELVMVYPQYSWTAAHKDQAETLFQILSRDRAGYLIPQISPSEHLVTLLYHWCTEYNGRFTLQESYNRFVEHARKYKGSHSTVVMLLECEPVVKLKFEYVYKSVAREHYANGGFILEQHRRESFLYPVLVTIDFELRPYDRYARLMSHFGIEYDRGNGIDTYFAGLLRQELAERSKVLDSPAVA